MVLFLTEWNLVIATVLLSFLAVCATNTRGNPRIMRILARNLFVLSLLCLCYKSALVGIADLQAVAAREAASHTAALAAPVGDSIVGGPSLSASFVNEVLATAGSPAQGTGQSLYDLSVLYHIDDAYALATFEHESSYGKYGAAAQDRSLGNIICAGYPTCNGRFRSYASWQQSYDDFYSLIAHQYIAEGLTTIGSIIPRYAPSTENNTGEYIQTIRSAIIAFRSGQTTA